MGELRLKLLILFGLFGAALPVHPSQDGFFTDEEWMDTVC